MLTEIKEMPVKAKEFLKRSEHFTLPLHVPYIGMGSSYFAPLAFKYMGLPIYPELASEFYNYLARGKKHKNGVLLSQSGKSTEVLWCTALFEQFMAITNDTESPLGKAPSMSSVIPLLAGEE